MSGHNTGPAVELDAFLMPLNDSCSESLEPRLLHSATVMRMQWPHMMMITVDKFYNNNWTAHTFQFTDKKGKVIDWPSNSPGWFITKSALLINPQRKKKPNSTFASTTTNSASKNFSHFMFGWVFVFYDRMQCPKLLSIQCCEIVFAPYLMVTSSNKF